MENFFEKFLLLKNWAIIITKAYQRRAKVVVVSNCQNAMHNNQSNRGRRKEEVNAMKERERDASYMILWGDQCKV